MKYIYLGFSSLLFTSFVNFPFFIIFCKSNRPVLQFQLNLQKPEAFSHSNGYIQTHKKLEIIMDFVSLWASLVTGEVPKCPRKLARPKSGNEGFLSCFCPSQLSVNPGGHGVSSSTDKGVPGTIVWALSEFWLQNSIHLVPSKGRISVGFHFVDCFLGDKKSGTKLCLNG